MSFLEVEDNGPGIPASERERICERFYRLPGASGSGCGLGLSIATEVARLHDTRLQIESGLDGRGARMRVEFPSGQSALGSIATDHTVRKHSNKCSGPFPSAKEL